MTRQEHLDWAKDRALAEADRTSGFAGWISFKSDMSTHPETAGHIALSIGDQMVAMMAKQALSGDPSQAELLRVFDLPGPFNMKRFIEGVN